jgi:hypothetical protein
MKTTSRKKLLKLMLALILLAGSGIAAQGELPPPTGICSTFCVGPSGWKTVNWSTTQSICCSGTVNPCPAGMTPTSSSFKLSGGNAVFCQN